jgi:hypothetical protein
MKHPIAIAAQARKIEARIGGSITKNKIAPETIASTLAIIATTIETPRSCFIANVPLTDRALTDTDLCVYAMMSFARDQTNV